MTFWAVLSLLAAVPVPPECEPPPLHDVTPLKTFTQRSGTLSVGLDSVATWCFDSGGAWTGGVRPEPGKKPKPADPNAPAVGDCARSLTSCEDAKASLTAELTQALTDALADFERPFRGQRYVPKRTGLAERPSPTVNCRERSRPELFAQAQARMDLARLASSVQNEYANYKTWLYARGLECGQQVRAGRVDTTKVAVSVDAAPATGGGVASKVVAAGGGASAPKLAGNTGGGTALVAIGPPPSRATMVVGTSGSATTDSGARASGSGTNATVGAPVGNPGVAVSATNPSGTPPIGAADTNPSGTPPIGPATVTTPEVSAGTTPEGTPAIGTMTASVSGLGTTSPTSTLPAANDAGAASNELLETWRMLANQRGKMELDRDYTLGFLASRELRDCRCQRTSPAGIVSRLETSDGVSQIEGDSPRAIACEHCLQNAFAAWRGRVQKQCALLPELSQYELEVLQKSDDGNGLPPRCLIEAYSKRGLDAGVLFAQPAAPPRPPIAPATGASTTLTVGLDPKGSGKPPQPGPTGAPRFEPSSALADGFFHPADAAPIPLREDGRLYVRVFMSSTCAADVLPGPVLARTGDLLLIPYGARTLSLRSPCGGLAEVYWGREPTPRVSEVFGRNQPLHFQFKPQ